MNSQVKPQRYCFRWSRQIYGRLAPVYDFVAPFLLGILPEGYTRAAEDVPSGKVLDAACGTGKLLALLGRDGDKVCVGVDISPGMLKQAHRQAPQALLVRASIDALPFRSEAFETVLETNALGVAEINPCPVLEEMVRVCATGGEIRLVDYSMPEKRTVWGRFTAWLGACLGDKPYDYGRFLLGLGCAVRAEILTGDGTIRFYRARKGREKISSMADDRPETTAGQQV